MIFVDGWPPASFLSFVGTTSQDQWLPITMSVICNALGLGPPARGKLGLCWTHIAAIFTQLDLYWVFNKLGQVYFGLGDCNHVHQLNPCQSMLDVGPKYGHMALPNSNTGDSRATRPQNCTPNTFQGRMNAPKTGSLRQPCEEVPSLLCLDIHFPRWTFVYCCGCIRMFGSSIVQTPLNIRNLNFKIGFKVLCFWVGNQMLFLSRTGVHWHGLCHPELSYKSTSFFVLLAL